MRTEEEIRKQTDAGEQFIKRHPHSIFGTDNVKHFRIFQKLVEKARKGQTAKALEEFVNDAYEDSEDNSFASGVIEWLFYDGDPAYDESEGGEG